MNYFARRLVLTERQRETRKPSVNIIAVVKFPFHLVLAIFLLNSVLIPSKKTYYRLSETTMFLFQSMSREYKLTFELKMTFRRSAFRSMVLGHVVRDEKRELPFVSGYVAEIT